MHYDKCYVRDMNEVLGELRDELKVGMCWKNLCEALKLIFTIVKKSLIYLFTHSFASQRFFHIAHILPPSVNHIWTKYRW